MGLRKNDDEKVIVAAFLRSGHPWFAFGTVVLKSGLRIAICAALVGLATQQGVAVPELVRLISTVF